jgi:hypothetical protein
MVAALGAFLIVNAPIDYRFRSWTPDSLPPGWASIRDRWETFHALWTGLTVAGFACLA